MRRGPDLAAAVVLGLFMLALFVFAVAVAVWLMGSR